MNKIPDGIKKLTSDDTHRCAPQEGTIYCVRARRKDRSIGHQHFAANEYRKAVAYQKQIKAEEHKPDTESPAKAGDTFETYAERWRGVHPAKDPTAVHSPLKRAYALIGTEGLTAIDRSRLLKLQADLFKRYAYNTVDLTMHYVKTVMRSAVDDGLLERDPTVRLKMPARDSLDDEGVVTTDDVPTHAEVLAMLDAAPLRWRYAIALGLGCGLRVGEVLGVTPAQVNVFAGTVTVDAQEQRRGRVSPKRKRSVRTVEVPDRVLDELRRAMRVHKWGDGAPLSTGARGAVARRDEFYKQAWKPTLRGAGLAEDAYKFHAGRHYAASTMLGRGVPATEVAHYLGDTLETVSRVYAHWLRDAPAMAKGALNQALARPSRKLTAEPSE